MTHSTGHSSRWPRFLSMAVPVLLAISMLTACASNPGLDDGLASGLESAVDDTPARRRARTHLALASGYFENGQTAVALAEARHAVELDPRFSEAHNVLGSIYVETGDAPRGKAHFQKAIELNSRNANAMNNLAWLLCHDQAYAEADAQFQKALAAPNSNRARTLLAQGICQARSGDTARAENTLMHSLEMDAGNPVTGYNLALLLYQRGDYDKARFYIRRINNSELANSESLWLGMRIERRLGNQQAVDELGRQLSRRFPDSRELIAYQRGQFDE